jgi:hypothetical protein
MSLKLTTYGICFLFIISAGCGIFDPGPSPGTLKIIFDESDTNAQLKKSSGGVLSAAQVIIEKRNSVAYVDFLKKAGNVFHTEITSLQPGHDYSVTLYGRHDISYYIATSAHQSDVSITEGDETLVKLSWSPFITTLSSPDLGDTLTGDYIHLEWEPVPGANKYHLIVDDDNFFTNPCIDNTRDDNQVTINFESFPEGTYFWRVQCIGSWKSKETLNSQLLDRDGIWSRISRFEFKKQQ